MNTLRRLLVSIVGGVVALFAGGLAVTALLEPYVWPSLMLGVPAGLVAGGSTAVLLYAWLTYRSERRVNGTVSPRTRSLLAGSVGGVVGFVVAGTLAAAVVASMAFGLASAMLFVGLPVGVVGAAVGAAVAVLYGRRRGRTPGPTAQ